jgi:hypothetical protein
MQRYTKTPTLQKLQDESKQRRRLKVALSGRSCYVEEEDYSCCLARFLILASTDARSKRRNQVYLGFALPEGGRRSL